MMRDWRSRLSRDLVWRAVKISFVVGSILNLINQGEVLWGAAELSIVHVLLNYLVPFAVSIFSVHLQRHAGPRAEPACVKRGQNT